MDKREAEGLLQVALERFRQEPYDALVAQIGGDPAIEEMRGASGAVYQLEGVFALPIQPERFHALQSAHVLGL